MALKIPFNIVMIYFDPWAVQWSYDSWSSIQQDDGPFIIFEVQLSIIVSDTGSPIVSRFHSIH
jgi:hypothetical protein